MFGVPLGQCVENERLVRCGKVDPLRRDDSEELRRKSHHGSHSSFTSLVESASTSTKDQVRLYSAFHPLLNIGVRGCSSCLFSPRFILDVFMCPIPLIAEGSFFSLLVIATIVKQYLIGAGLPDNLRTETTRCIKLTTYELGLTIASVIISYWKKHNLFLVLIMLNSNVKGGLNL